MAIFKCKMCGGTLEINNETVAVCQYCGTKQTLPKLDDDRKANLYDRANHFRRNNEFDKAMGIYEQILNDDNTDAETYWSLVLCRYGIEYVEDPSSHNRIPTVNRAQFTSIYDDEDYKSAIKHADKYQKELYESEANTINETHKKILAISGREEPFDVFICYKETDANGRRTPDSVLATELYHELTREGFKVFFSRITLEDKLGQEYEPYIFAALNSAKVMVAIGTKPEYFNAVWVKNEWSRYLALIKNGARKMLIPAYKDMDPYDLPEEFSHLQAQDMSKLGFMQDIIHGIKKIVETKVQTQPVREKNVVTVKENSSENITILLKRGFMAIEDSEWFKARKFAERILSLDPECCDAYLIKLMADMKVRKLEEFAKCKKRFEKNTNYKRALRFGNKQLEQICQKNLEERTSRKLEKKKKRIKRAKIIIPITAVVLAVTSFFMFFNFNMWTDIVDVYAGSDYTVGLKKDGTVVATGSNYYGQCNVDNWTDIVSIYIGDDYTVGLKKDGTVVATGYNGSGACNVSSWTDIVSIYTGNGTVGIKKNGTVVTTNVDFQNGVKNWNNIISVCTGSDYIVGLKKDGTVVAAGNNDYGQCNVSGWTNIASIYTAHDYVRVYKNYIGYESERVYYTVGLKKDGTIVATGDNQYGNCNVISSWTNIDSIYTWGGYYTVGLKKDGTVVAIGKNDDGQCNVSGWTDVISIGLSNYNYNCTTIGLKKDGTVIATDSYAQRSVSGWNDIISISTGEYHIIGLKKDGTVVATGVNYSGQCDVRRTKNPFKGW